VACALSNRIEKRKVCVLVFAAGLGPLEAGSVWEVPGLYNISILFLTKNTEDAGGLR
jgi:hypothetical protein